MKLRSALLVFVLVFFAPFVIFAQSVDSDLETQIRTALQAQADIEDISQSELDALVAAMAEKAAEEGLDARAVEASYAPAQTEEEYGEEIEEDIYYDSNPVQGERGVGTLPVIAGVIVLLGLLFTVWKKMEGGGAIGGTER